jgi:hypothetical protein
MFIFAMNLVGVMNHIKVLEPDIECLGGHMERRNGDEPKV